MRALHVVLHEAWHEFRHGVRSGVVTLTFVGMIGYLLLVLASADNIQKLGATDVPRNGAILIYLMATGCMFFLFFAWAWVYAQPLVRDRKAYLHEIILSTPNSLQALLWGRFLGAVLVGALLSSATLFGFLIAPVLEWLHAVPPGSFTATPWHALVFSFLWLMFPVSVGVGALYFLATLRTRNVAGALGLSAFVVLLWMVAIIILKGGHIYPGLSIVLDPSLFTYAQGMADVWTPVERSSALLPVTSAVLINRFVWCLAPVLILAVVLRRIQRESLVLDRGSTGRVRSGRNLLARAERTKATVLPGAVQRTAWLRVFLLETGWQLRLAFGKRPVWLAAVFLVIMGVLSAFVHVVWHAEGPMVPRPDMLLPLLEQLIYLVIAFVIAALAGYISRRDDVLGVEEALDAAPAPGSLRLLARALAVIALTFVFALLPGVCGLIVTALEEPRSLSLGLTLWYQAIVMAPPLMEIAIVAVLVHALFRRAGVAYAASMLLTFFMVVNHETELVTYPLYQVGMPGVVRLSLLSGSLPWRAYLLALGAYKLALCLLLVALAAMVLARGVDNRRHGAFARLRDRAAGVPGVLFLASGLALFGVGGMLKAKLVSEGSYLTPDQTRLRDAAWEKRWLESAAAYSVSGGELQLHVYSAHKRLDGTWLLHGVRSADGHLDAELPDGLEIKTIKVNGRAAHTETDEDHLRIDLGDCASTGCEVRLTWAAAPQGWSADGTPPWFIDDGLWMQARDVAPRLGIDPERMLRAPLMRKRYGLSPELSYPSGPASVAMDAIAPGGNWRWQVQVEGHGTSDTRTGTTAGPLSFGVAWAPAAERMELSGIQVIADPSRVDEAKAIADDVQSMSPCVARRLGTAIDVRAIAQWPRGLGRTELSGGLLQLAEEPSWDVANAGVGRSMRRARIAAALARRSLIDATDLRDARGAQWLRNGVAGAIGLLCVGDVDGPETLSRVIARGSDDTTEALAASTAPVGELALAPVEGWAEEYGPLATLSWLSQEQPGDLAQLLQQIRQEQSVPKALAAHVGDRSAAAMLGVPQSSVFTVKRVHNRIRVDGSRWRWQNGGWQQLPDSPVFDFLARINGSLRPLTAVGANYPLDQLPQPDGLLVDMWPAYPRSSAGALITRQDVSGTGR